MKAKLDVPLDCRAPITVGELATLMANYSEAISELKRLTAKCRLYGGPKGGKMDLSAAYAIIAKAEKKDKSA